LAGIDPNQFLKGTVVFRHACKLGLEGIVSKLLGSRYRSGHSRDWLKVKREAEEKKDNDRRSICHHE
jgi:ATP-dependent DNA ligase